MNGSDRMGMDKRKYFLLKTVIFLFMLAAALIALFPFYWMFVTAVKPIDEIFACLLYTSRCMYLSVWITKKGETVYERKNTEKQNTVLAEY